MIITDEKPWEEIKAALDDFKVKKIVIAACGICAAKVGTGGTEGAEKMKQKLESEGYEVITTVVIDEPCDERMANQALRKIKEEVKAADAIMSLACGLGTQSLNAVTRKKFDAIPALTALDTVFMGETEKFGKFHERCRACGQCLLNETGGICPITTCAKSLMNGPCGGSVDGKCEVMNYTQPCGWILIYDALKKIDRLDLFLKIREPRNWDKGPGRQRDLNVPREGITPGEPLGTGGKL
ncbi:MAG: methylenetetrahydrofolate reductase C-terminal domain-containing protein [Promethearchaeota archaeon]